jgi:hypothetical protein
MFNSGSIRNFVKVRNVGILIEQTAINLGLPFSEFKNECCRFCDAVLSSSELGQA